MNKLTIKQTFNKLKFKTVKKCSYNTNDRGGSWGSWIGNISW